MCLYLYGFVLALNPESQDISAVCCCLCRVIFVLPCLNYLHRHNVVFSRLLLCRPPAVGSISVFVSVGRGGISLGGPFPRTLTSWVHPHYVVGTALISSCSVCTKAVDDVFMCACGIVLPPAAFSVMCVSWRGQSEVTEV